MAIRSKCVSSLEKVMPGAAFDDFCEYNKSSALMGERFNFQIAYTLSERGRMRLSVDIKSTLKDVSVRSVAYVPSLMPCYDDHDENVITDKPGLFPDVLEPVSNNGFAVTGNRVSVLWITVNTADAVGTHEIKLRLYSGDTTYCETVFVLDVLPAKLPNQTLICTNWFHTDCLADYYNFPVFSEEHWRGIGRYMKTAVEHGINMILTPLFTPPLDTAVGHERTTVQLVDVEKNGDKYAFGFEKLKKWAAVAQENGVEYLELSHLYTQWGANNAPKIVATENGEYKRIFGWETDAYGEEYVGFLSQLFPALVAFIRENKLEKSVYFHISDEPSVDHIEKYSSASALLRKYIGDEFPVIDALSSYEFYETGACKTPIPGTNHADIFYDHGVENLWCYYCCSQNRDVANRFFSMPSARNRVLGVQLYKYNIKGFLQWGYNFWNSQFSLERIDPYAVSDAREAFPSGDAYVVYPGMDGYPVCSLRLEVFYDALQDMRALTALENKIGRQKVIDIIDEGLESPITFKKYPQSAEWLLALREKINNKIIE